MKLSCRSGNGHTVMTVLSRNCNGSKPFGLVSHDTLGPHPLSLCTFLVKIQMCAFCLKAQPKQQTKEVMMSGVTCAKASAVAS